MEKSDEAAAVFATDSDHKAQFDALSKLFENEMPTPLNGPVDVAKVVRMIDTVVALETGSMVVSRQFVTLITERLEKGDVPSDVVQYIAQGILGIIKTRTISYEDQVCTLRLLLANIYEEQGLILDAAHMLIAINSDTSPKFNNLKALTEGMRAQLCIRITRLLLQAKDIDEAEQFVNRTSMLLPDTKNEELVLEHKALQAQVFDAKRRFVDAAQRFYEISQAPANLLQESDRLAALGKCIACVILAKPGNPRTRLLTALVKDERAHQLPSFELVTKMYFHRLIHPNELIEFEKGLQPHQKLNENDESILKTVIQEHNITAVSQLYDNISFETLGELLNASPDNAELMAGEMIASDRVAGYIDQTTNVNQLGSWDMEILRTLQQVNKTSEQIVAKRPEFAEMIQ